MVLASTNKTTNYQLPQWVGTDHPSFLEDFNPAFEKIDETLKAIDDKATGGGGSGGTTVATGITFETSGSEPVTKYTNVQDAVYKIDQKNAEQDTAISGAQSAAGTAQSTATEAKSTADGVATRVTTIEGTKLAAPITCDQWDKGLFYVAITE